ncbi:MAG: TolC family protein [Firmicutes bacterium]|nr:TolC family protein [Bacillota bacterium]
MKKKIMPAIMLALLLSFSSISTYAASSSTISAEQTAEVLTVEEATKRAIEYSHTIKTLNESTDISEKTADDTRQDLVNSSDSTSTITLNTQLKNLMNSISSNKANTEIEKEKIRLNVIETFASIINAENELDIYEKQLHISERELKIAEVKINLGLISQSDYDALVISNKNTKSSKQSLEIALKQAYTSLNKILGRDLTTTYTVTLDIEYSPLGDANVDLAASRAASSSQTVKDKENAEAVAKYRLDTYSYTDATINEYKQSYRNNYAQATRDTADAKVNAENNVRNVYNSILTSETNYNTNLQNLTQKTSELEILKKKLELGKITQLEYDKAELEIERLENTMEQNVYSHYVLVCRFNDPDLI